MNLAKLWWGSSPARRTGGFSDDQLCAGQCDWLAGGWPPSIMRSSSARIRCAAWSASTPNRGQWHHLELRLGNIVKADDRNIAWDLPAGLVERPKDPHRHFGHLAAKIAVTSSAVLVVMLVRSSLGVLSQGADAGRPEVLA
jgi:hypothetical protein